MNNKKEVKINQLLNKHRALFFFLILFAFLSVFAPNFFNTYNFTAILKGASLNAIVAIGFTVILIAGELDLSIGSMVMLAGMLVIGLQPSLGWTLSIIVSTLSGVIVGLVNGILVTKAKIDSFIVTLGMMIILEGVMHLYSGGNSMFAGDFVLADWLETAIIPLLPPRVIITIILIAISALILKKTRFGRGIYMVGGNAETAWLAGLNRDLYKISAFVISSTMSALGGILFAMSLASMAGNAILGNRTLMTVLAAVIIGGTGLNGGKGNVIKSVFGVLLLTTLFNGIGCFGLGFEIQIFLNGLILAVVVLYEAYAEYRHKLMKGQRAGLMEELEDGKPANP